jgi:hypothetical protein
MCQFPYGTNHRCNASDVIEQRVQNTSSTRCFQNFPFKLSGRIFAVGANLILFENSELKTRCPLSQLKLTDHQRIVNSKFFSRSRLFVLLMIMIQGVFCFMESTIVSESRSESERLKRMDRYRLANVPSVVSIQRMGSATVMDRVEAAIS